MAVFVVNFIWKTSQFTTKPHFAASGWLWVMKTIIFATFVSLERVKNKVSLCSLPLMQWSIVYWPNSCWKIPPCAWGTSSQAKVNIWSHSHYQRSDTFENSSFISIVFSHLIFIYGLRKSVTIFITGYLPLMVTLASSYQYHAVESILTFCFHW